MGAVFLAEDTRLGRKAALKLMRPELAHQGLSRERFLREARLQASIDHDFVTPIWQVGEHRGVPYIAMPLLHGETLEARLQHEPIPPLATTLKVAREVASGLAAAHAQGLVHRDIKPANIWLEGDLSSATESLRFRRCRLLDFGLARPTDPNDEDAHLTLTSAIVGTPAFMSPEQAAGNTTDARTDLWSLGVVLYRMLTGVLPFRGKTASAVITALATETPPPVGERAGHVPRELSDLVASLMTRNPAKRIASAKAVLEALDHITIGSPLSTLTLELAEPPVPRRRPWRFASVAVLLAVGVALAVLIPRGDSSPPPAPVDTIATPGEAAPVARTIDLLALTDPKRDAVEGTWTKHGDALVAQGGFVNNVPVYPVLQFPYSPPQEYDYRVEFTRDSGAGDVSPVLSHGDRQFQFSLGADNHLFGFNELNGRHINEQSNAYRAEQLASGRRYTTLIQVRNDGVTAYLDGQKLRELRTDYMNLEPAFIFRNCNHALLGLSANFRVRATFHRVEVTEVTGRGVFQRPASPEPEPEAIVNSLGMRFVRVPAGSFIMGSPTPPRNPDETAHEVTLTRPYYLAAFAVSQEDFFRVMGFNPSTFSARGEQQQRVAGTSTWRLPVDTVSWFAAQEFCRRLGRITPEAQAGRTYRLPTEAEWEHACRICYGTDVVQTTGSAGRPRPVDAPPAGKLGLHGMIGNLWEWCEDRYEPHRPEAVTNPTGPASGDRRVLRGLCWNDNRAASVLRIAQRDGVPPNITLNVAGGGITGFRVVCVPGSPKPP